MNLGIEKIAKLPNKQKVVILILLLVAVGAAMVFFLIRPKYKDLKAAEAKLGTLQTQLQSDRKAAANLPALIKEYERLNSSLQAALTELPNQKEIPGLLTSVTDGGKKAGLDFLLFRPKSEEKKDFYAAVPVDITVSGSYESIGNFFSSVANLPRIVNISNVNVSDIKKTGERNIMKVSCLATTFRFLDEKEKAETKDQKAKKDKK
jgi:type IV pilus assembly protein PilO